MTVLNKLVEASPAALADHIGQLRADKDAIAKQLKDAEALLKDITGGEPAEGTLFRVVFVEAVRTTVNWKKIAAKLNPSRQLVTANSRDAVVNSVKVSALSK